MIKRIAYLGVVLALLGAQAPHVQAGDAVAFPSFTDWGEPTKLSGLLSKPSGSGPFPAIVLLHDCAGLAGGSAAQWEKTLLQWGYAVLRVDSFAPRGLKNVCKYETTGSYDEDVFEADTRVEDAYGGLQYLSGLPFIARDRIGLMGLSHGGAAVLNTLVAGPPPEPFGAAVALYPSCGTILAEINAPLLILIGGADTWSVAKVCEQLEQPTMGDHRFQRVVYPSAHHGFDEAGADRDSLGHRIQYDKTAAADAMARISAFFAKHLK